MDVKTTKDVRLFNRWNKKDILGNLLKYMRNDPNALASNILKTYILKNGGQIQDEELVEYQLGIKASHFCDTQYNLALILGINRTTLSRWQNNGILSKQFSKIVNIGGRIQSVKYYDLSYVQKEIERYKILQKEKQIIPLQRKKLSQEQMQEHISEIYLSLKLFE